MGLSSLRFLCLFFSSLALGPAIAQLFQARYKIYLSGAGDQAVQQIYFDWMILGIIVACAMLTTLDLTILVRKQQKAFICTLIALLCLVGAQVILRAVSWRREIAQELED